MHYPERGTKLYVRGDVRKTSRRDYVFLSPLHMYTRAASAQFVRQADRDVSSEVDAYAKWLGLQFERTPAGMCVCVDHLHAPDKCDYVQCCSSNNITL